MSWSTFIIHIGTPPQEFKILPSTNGFQTWVPVPAGCTSSDPSNCAVLRGALPFGGNTSTGFLSNQSSTWKENGLFSLLTDNPLDRSGNGDYGFDTVGLLSEVYGGPNLTQQVVAGIATDDFYLGQLGIGHKPSNFTTFEYPHSAYMANLAASNLIPSLSYGYTAGAKYRKPTVTWVWILTLAEITQGLNSVLGSLTLGGYDSSRFTLSDFTIPFAADDTRNLTVGVQSITASNTIHGSVELLSTGDYFLIDSSVADLWLPEPAYQAFEQAFGLIYDNETDLYVVNDSIHSHLQQLNPAVTFKVGIQNSGGPTVDITLPYGAFDLQATSPYYKNATNYFPLRRATNNTQYTLGRTFLQECYIIVDLERSNFSVNPAVFNIHGGESFVTIHSTKYGTSQHHELDHGAFAGIAVGATAFFLAVLAVLLFLIRKHRKSKKASHQSPPELDDRQKGALNNSSREWIHELGHKIDTPQSPQHLASSEIQELTTNYTPFELIGSIGAGELPELLSPKGTSPRSQTGSA